MWRITWHNATYQRVLGDDVANEDTKKNYAYFTMRDNLTGNKQDRL